MLNLIYLSSRRLTEKNQTNLVYSQEGYCRSAPTYPYHGVFLAVLLLYKSDEFEFLLIKWVRD